MVAAVLYLPWLPSLLAQITRVQAGFWVPKPRVPNLFWTFTLVAGFDLDYLKPLVSRLLDLSSHVAWGYVLVGVSLLTAAEVPREAVTVEHWRPGRLCVGRWK